MEVPKTLAIDYGTVRVGLAVSAYTLADPLVTILNDDQLFIKISQICQANQVDLVLVGISENEMEKKTRIFAKELENHISVPIEFTDETLSSYTVHNKLKTAKKSKRSGDIDHFAAAEFLQDWLDEKY